MGKNRIPGEDPKSFKKSPPKPVGTLSSCIVLGDVFPKEEDLKQGDKGTRGGSTAWGWNHVSSSRGEKINHVAREIKKSGEKGFDTARAADNLAQRGGPLLGA